MHNNKTRARRSASSSARAQLSCKRWIMHSLYQHTKYVMEMVRGSVGGGLMAIKFSSKTFPVTTKNTVIKFADVPVCIKSRANYQRLADATKQRSFELQIMISQ